MTNANFLIEEYPLSLLPGSPFEDSHQVIDADTAYIFKIVGDRERAEAIVATLNAAAEIERLREAAKGAAVIASTSGSLLKEKDAEIERLRSELGKAKSVSDEMVAVAYNRFINATTETEECERCKGVGYHHGFGERGHEPDWCEGCGGPGIQPKYDEKTAMRLALESALAGGTRDPDEGLPTAEDVRGILK